MTSNHWNPFHDRHFDIAGETPKSCKYGKEMDKWALETFDSVLKYPDVISINQSKLRLLDRYFDYYASIPKAHKECTGERSHLCIYHVFRHYYNQLKLCELRINPPLLFIPPEPKIQVVEIDAPDLGDFAR